MQKRWSFSALLLGVVGGTFALSGCDRSLEARLQDAAGIEEAAPVYFAGVRVGEVDSVRIDGERAEIEFSIESEHDVTLHRDACAVAGRYQETPALLLFAGDEGEYDDSTPLPDCRLTPDDLREWLRALGEGFRVLFREIGQGVAEAARTIPRPGATPPSPPPPPVTPPPAAPDTGDGGVEPDGATPPAPRPQPRRTAPAPRPPPPRRVSPCAAVSIRVTNVRPEPATMLHLPNGGHRVSFQFANGNDFAMRMSAVTNASFMDSSRRALAPARMPGSGTWFMPFDVPGRGSRQVSVIFPANSSGAAPAITAVEVRRASPASSRLAWCTVR